MGKAKPKEVIVVGSKVKEVLAAPPELGIDLFDSLDATISWEIDIAPMSPSSTPGFTHSFFDDTTPYSSLSWDAITLMEDPLGITAAFNDNVPEVGDEVLISFIAGDAMGRPYRTDIYLNDPSGAAFDIATLVTPLDLDLSDYSEATLSLSEVGGGSPFAVADIDSLESMVVPEPSSIVLVVTMIGTAAASWVWKRGRNLWDAEEIAECES